jgi:hypothetical protein
MQADYSYILTTAGWGLPMATGTKPNRVQYGIVVNQTKLPVII